jgi:hypothetical protein
MSTTKIMVISEAGKLVGTHVAAPGGSEGKGPVAQVVPGPGQVVREIEVDFEVPTKFANPEAVRGFHEKVRRAATLK